MCGIGGIYNRSGIEPSSSVILDDMIEALNHRGPDGCGKWIDPPSGIGMCHTRLAVLDLSPRGSQPMTDIDGRGWIVYNGEVYNYLEIRRELEGLGYQFKSETDSEVVLAACLQWGVDKALHRFTGMFAFALWNTQEHVLYLVRDRLGIKPLYYGYAGDDFLFGSELKTLCAHPLFDRSLDPRSIEQYLMLRYVPAPGTIYRHARKLPGAHYLRVAPEGERIQRYWSASSESMPPWSTGKNGYMDELDQMVTEAIRSRLVSDVPLGTFLSGGLDSSLVTARMIQSLQGTLSAYTVSFEEDAFDEGPQAAKAADHFQARHRVLNIRCRDVLDGLEKMPYVFDEPLSDPSALALLRLSEFARREVTVILSGDGGDELFGGYDRYRFLQSYLKGFGRCPALLRRGSSIFLRSLPSAALGFMYNGLFSLTGRSRPVENFSGKWEKLVRLFRQDDPASAYQVSVGVFSAEETSAILGREHAVSLPETFIRNLQPSGKGGITRRNMMDLDLETFLPEDVLAKVDRVSMAFGLEVRVPLLDHRIVELAQRIPEIDLFEGGHGKAPLRRVAQRVLPKELMERPKMGFTLPLDVWFRNELRETLQDYLLRPNGNLQGLFDMSSVRGLIRSHLSGRSNHQEKIYNLLTLDMWMDRWTRVA